MFEIVLNVLYTSDEGVGRGSGTRDGSLIYRDIVSVYYTELQDIKYQD